MDHLRGSIEVICGGHVGRPACYTDPIILVGAREAYEARRRECHGVPGRPGNPR